MSGDPGAAPAEFDPRRLLARLEEISVGLPFEVTSRPMMGGFIAYADGAVFVSLSRGGFGVKLTGADHAALLARPGARRQRHLADQPESATYVALSEADVDDDDVLLSWLTRAGQAARERASRPRRARG